MVDDKQPQEQPKEIKPYHCLVCTTDFVDTVVKNNVCDICREKLKVSTQSTRPKDMSKLEVEIDIQPPQGKEFDLDQAATDYWLEKDYDVDTNQGSYFSATAVEIAYKAGFHKAQSELVRELREWCERMPKDSDAHDALAFLESVVKK